MGILRAIFRFLIGMVKQWLGYIWKATGVVAALVFSPYVQYGADIRQDVVYFIYVYVASIVVLRITYRNSRWSLWYAQQFFGFVQWFLAVVASIMAPFVPVFFPFLTLPGIVPKLAISLLIIIFLLFIGVFVALGEIFKRVEDDWVDAFQKGYATPDYEAILMGEEFEHQPELKLTRRERLRKWWEEERRLFRRFLRKLRNA
jgi:hypothetical protein